MARSSTARQPRDPQPVTHPLVTLEEYAREDLIKESASVLVAVERAVATWGTEHERHVALIVQQSLTVTDPASYVDVSDRLRDAAERIKAIEGWFDPRKGLAFKLHRIVCGRENAILDPLRAWMKSAKANWDTFARKDEQRRREEEARLAREAQEAEQRRLQDEAAQLEAQGDTQLAAQIIEQAIAMPAPVITLASTLPEVRGVTRRENWTWRPLGGDTPANRVRMRQLLPRDYLIEDEKKLTAAAKHKGSLRIPGVEFYDAGSVTVR